MDVLVLLQLKPECPCRRKKGATSSQPPYLGVLFGHASRTDIVTQADKLTEHIVPDECRNTGPA
jgi:hypothetical protein